MRDAQTHLRAKGLAPMKIERTNPQPGERYFIGHRCVRMGDPLPVVVDLPEPDPDLSHGKWGGSHPIVTHGPIVLGILAVVMIGAAVLSATGVW